ncbi:MAG TPA: bifunctional UDP-N-acetylglucosamine diphosphorylase/glucosamine-1-phosphate N-acetyltransferase GlmU [Gammaproteobacteria bacterium]|nr:bifunctional UDP-N-acetylglucosamine diphosphorylase/glucosamine-1-phosphate N-acetyltransferase GlmU [Gammaproteobacteria bacterium]
MPLSIVILAAGQGKRMHSDLPKVLQPLGGRCLLEHVVAAARALPKASLHVVYGHGGERVKEALAHLPVTWVHQAEQLGTGHAVAQALPQIDDRDLVLVLYGDVPLVRTETMGALALLAAPGALAVLTTRLADPTGYGRVLRDAGGSVIRIVEEKDANAAERKIDEVSTGLIAAPAAMLRDWVSRLDNDNAQGEYYLTDVIAMAAADGVPVAGTNASAQEVLGINDRVQLSEAEAALRQRKAEALMRAGVTLRDPTRIDVRGELNCGRDVIIDVGCVFEGAVTLGDGVRVGPYCVIRDADIAARTEIFSHTLIDEAVIGRDCRIGPFARLRPGAQLAAEVHVGNFVEIKKSEIGAGSKANHLSYIGDASVGSGVNVGAGTITCNYDGVNKHRTVIGDGVFVGSDTQFVAPVTIGAGATIGAGSTITKDVPADVLALSRVRQAVLPGWKRPEKKKT